VARAEASVVINRPVEEVFAFARNPVHHPQWETAQFDVEQTSEGPMGVGTMFRGGIRFVGRSIDWTAECTTYHPGREVGFEVHAGPMHLEESLTFQPVEGGTRVTLAYEGELRGLFKLAGPIAVGMFQRQTEGDLARLKGIMEAQAEAAG
jgi:uncharacterized membrane protein